MNYRIIVYDIGAGEYEQAVKMATIEYRRRYGAEPKNVTLPVKRPIGLVLCDGVLDVGGLQLEIDRFYALPGTCQVGR